VANNKSAKKRIQISERNRLINKSYKSTVRTLTKKTLENCEKYKKDPNEDNKNLVGNRRPFSNGELFSLFLLIIIISISLICSIFIASFTGKELDTIPIWLVK